MRYEPHVRDVLPVRGDELLQVVQSGHQVNPHARFHHTNGHVMKMVPEAWYGRDMNPKVEVEVTVRLQQGMEGQASQRNHHATNGTLRGTVMGNRGVLGGKRGVSPLHGWVAAGARGHRVGTNPWHAARSEEGSRANYFGAKGAVASWPQRACRRAQDLFMESLELSTAGCIVAFLVMKHIQAVQEQPRLASTHQTLCFGMRRQGDTH